MEGAVIVHAPALPDEVCPTCHAANHGAAVTVWRVADERGPHYECDGCGCSWRDPVAVATYLRLVRFPHTLDGQS